jgi:Autophagy protein 16 (ATG16)
MSAWRKEYLQGLEDRDRREKADLGVFISCELSWKITWTVPLMRRQDTKLADRASILSTLPRRGNTALGPELEPSGAGRGHPITAVPESVPVEASSETLAALRLDLAEAQRSKSQLQVQLKAISEELQMLKDKSDREGRALTQLSTERITLATRIRDRDEELKGKSKLLEV